MLTYLKYVSLLFIGTSAFQITTLESDSECYTFTAGDSTCHVPSPHTHTWQGAVEYCRSVSGTLSVLDTQSKLQAVGQVMSLNMWQLIWTGVRLERLNEWTWQDRIDTGVGDFTNWSAGLPLDQDCVVIDPDAGLTWSDKSCTTLASGYICQLDLPLEWLRCGRAVMEFDLAFISRSRCFWISYNRVTWHEAVGMCHKEGGVLASLDHRDVHNALIQTSQASGIQGDTTGLWIGLSRLDWSTVHGGPLMNYWWGQGQPTSEGDCVGVELKGAETQTWISKNCDEHLNHFCEIDVPVKGSTTVLMVAKNTTLTEENGLNITEHDSTIIVTSLDSQEHTTELFLNDKHNKSAYIINKNVTSEPSSISPNPPTTQQSDTSKATSHAQTSAGVTMSSQITSTYPIITSDAHTSSELIVLGVILSIVLLTVSSLAIIMIIWFLKRRMIKSSTESCISEVSASSGLDLINNPGGTLDYSPTQIVSSRPSSLRITNQRAGWITKSKSFTPLRLKERSKLHHLHTATRIPPEGSNDMYYNCWSIRADQMDSK